MKWFNLDEYRSSLLPKSDLRLFNRWASSVCVDKYTYHNPADLIRYLQGEWRGSRYNPERPPCTDHARLFKNSRTGKIWFVSQPYDYMEAVAEEVTPWAAEHGLSVTVYPKDLSWYYPGETCLVVFTR